jgi:hypothetical protein
VYLSLADTENDGGYAESAEDNAINDNDADQDQSQLLDSQQTIPRRDE